MPSNTARSLKLQTSPKPHPVGWVRLSSQGSELTPTWSHHHGSPRLEGMASWDGMGQGVFWIQAGKDRNAGLGGVGHQRRLAGG